VPKSNFPTASAFGFASLLLATACGQDPTAPPDLGQISLLVVSGDGQSGVVGTELPQPLVIRATNSRGAGIADLTVNFHVTSGAGNMFAGSASTNSRGVAADYWTLGTSIAQVQAVEVRAVLANGQKQILGVFTATALPGPAAKIVAQAGEGQTTGAGTSVPSPPAVQVLDQYGNPIPDVAVTFAVTSGGGSVTGGNTTTNAGGIATAGGWALGPTEGDNTLTATAIGSGIVGNPVTFTATATPPLVILHAVYKGPEIRDVVYATRAVGGVWTSELAASNNDVGTALAVAAGPDGKVHIVYRATSGHIHYVTNRTGSWTTEPTYTTTTGPDDAAIAIATTPSGDPVVAFKGPGIREVRVARRTVGGWVDELAADNNDVGPRMAVAVGSDNVIHVAYRATGGHVHYVFGTTGSWVTEPLDIRSGMAQTNTLSLSVEGTVPISGFHGNFIREVIYGTRAGGVWNAETAASNNDVGDLVAITPLTGGGAMIVYRATGGDLHQVWGAPGAWQTSALDVSSDARLPSAIAAVVQ